MLIPEVRIAILRRLVGLLVLTGTLPAVAQELPYAARKLSFTGLTTTVQGDIRTVGMGGATVGLADTFIAAIDNPAGLAMTVGIGDIHFASNDIRDRHIQDFDTPSSTDSVGLALGLYPWAISLGYLSHYDEEATYRLRSLEENPIRLRVSTRELVLSAARVFFHDRLSLGVALILGQGVRELDSSSLKTDRSYYSYTAGVSLGATIQLPRRFLLGASFSSPLHYSGASESTERSLAIPGFFQSIEVPWRASLGLGFVPNRFFRADLTVHLFTGTPHAALVRDEAALVGQSVTLQPRFGVAYVFADLRELKSTLFGGVYYESTRITGTRDRVHGTLGLEARIWIFTVGGGLDLAAGYRDVQVSIGADVFGILARLAVIPPFGTPASIRLFPNPFRFSDEGLARPLVKDWKPSARDVDAIKVGLGIPKNLKQGFKNAGKELRQLGRNMAEGMAASNETAEEKRARAARIAEAAALAKQIDDAKRADEVARLAAVKLVEEEAIKQAEEAKLADLARAARLKRHRAKHRRATPPAARAADPVGR